MYPYSDQNSNGQYQGGYPPAYQSTPDYYRPMSPVGSRRRHEGWSVGTVALFWLVLALIIGHHFIFWAFLFFGAYMFMKSRGRRHHFGRNYRQPYRFDQTNYYYPTYNRPEAYTGPSYDPQPDPTRPTSGWPAPYDTTRSDRNY